MATKQLCTFFLKGFLWGIEVQKVQEIIQHQEMTRVPCAPLAIRGLINLRGQIVTAFDLRRRLGFEDAPTSQKLPTNIIVRTDDGLMSFLVDEIRDVLELGDEIFEAPPETLSGIARQLICGAYKLKDRLLLALDFEKAIDLNLETKTN